MTAKKRHCRYQRCKGTNESVGVRIKKEENMFKLIASVDTDESRTINFEEFITLMKTKMSEMIKAFKLSDNNDTGRILF